MLGRMITTSPPALATHDASQMVLKTAQTLEIIPNKNWRAFLLLS